MEIIVALKFISIGILITLTILSVSYKFKKDINENKLIWKILYSFIFFIGLLILTFSVIDQKPTDNTYYDSRFVYITYIAMNFNVVSILLSIFYMLVFISIHYSGSALIINMVGLLLPLIFVYLLKYVFKKSLHNFKFIHNLILSFLVNLLMFLLILILGELTIGFTILILIANPLMYTVVVRVVNFFNHIEILNYNNIIKNQKLVDSLDSTRKFEIYILNKNYEYLYFNEYHKIQMAKFNKESFKIGDNFLSKVDNQNVRDRLQKNIDLAFTGKAAKYQFLIEDGNDNYLEEIYTPSIVNDEVENVIIFSQNISDQINYEKQINFLSNYDSLTKLLNRRSLVKNSNQINKIKKYTVIFFDVNNLKFINDVFGHLKGDYLLKEVANQLKLNYENNEHIYRIGGDEFVVISTNKKHSNVSTATTLKDNLGKTMINNIPIKISFGIVRKKNKETIDELINIAENYMYQYKISSSSEELLNNINYIKEHLIQENIIDIEQQNRLIDHFDNIKDDLELDEEQVKSMIQFIELHNIGLVRSINNDNNNSNNYIEVGYRILTSSKEYYNTSVDIIHQYENYDGSGNPQNLKGEEISFNSRLLRVIKYYDLLLQRQDNNIIEKLNNEKGKVLDPNIVNILVKKIKGENQ